MPNTGQDWIDHFTLERHPEGGYYRETYRTDETVSTDALPDRFGGPRDVAALIYFLLPADAFSALHRIRQDEVWHFYAGCAPHPASDRPRQHLHDELAEQEALTETFPQHRGVIERLTR
ncbi:MAG: hypothetical protein BRD53_03180 [Bacteroidetes bacterium SW_7_64_58]|nr:MAG: hypothetical protein BRD53_03180 [Bacteroidetes bacterium SW_7_64_58]